MRKRTMRPTMLGARRPGVRRPSGRRPGGRRIPKKLAELGFTAARPGTGSFMSVPSVGDFNLPKMEADRKKALKGLLDAGGLVNVLGGPRKPNPGGRRPGGAGMGLGAMLGQLDRVPGGMSPGPRGRPKGMRPGSRDPGFYASLVRDRTDMADRVSLTDRLRGGTGATGGMPPQTGGNPFRQSRKMAEGGEVLKTPIDKLPNKGLKKLAKSPKGRKAVARMGFKDGGIAKGGKCPSRGTIRGTGAAIRGVGFKGIK